MIKLMEDAALYTRINARLVKSKIKTFILFVYWLAMLSWSEPSKQEWLGICQLKLNLP